MQGARPLPWIRHDCEPRPVAEAVPSGAEDSGLWTQADLIPFPVFCCQESELSSAKGAVG